MNSHRRLPTAPTRDYRADDMPPDAIARPTVSVVMIFLNAERFIDAAIESVLAQAGIDDWELVLVDDGSSDTSTEKAEAWARNDGRIRYVAHPDHRNEGMSASRNLGLRVARGRFVAFLDSDDIWLPAMLAQRVRLLEAHPAADAVLGPTWIWYGWTGRPLDRGRDRLIVLPYSTLRRPIRPPEIFVNIYNQPSGWLVPVPGSLFFRRQALLDIGGFEDEFRGLFEDQVLYVKAFTSLTFVLDDRPLTLYRQHGASACAIAEQTPDRADRVPNPARDRFVTWMMTYVGERFGTDSPEWTAAETSVQWEDADARQPPPWLRVKRRVRLTADRLAPRAAGTAITSINRRKASGAGPEVVDAWTSQFVASWASTMHGKVLIAHRTDDPPASTVLEMLTHTTVIASPLPEVPPGQNFDWVVVLPEAFDEMTEDTVLSTCRSLLAESGSLLALVPGPDLPSSIGRAPRRPFRSELDHLARTTFPTATITWEGFGSAGAVKAIERRLSPARAGVDLDHHDDRVEAMTGLSVATARHPTATPA